MIQRFKFLFLVIIWACFQLELESVSHASEPTTQPVNASREHVLYRKMLDADREIVVLTSEVGNPTVVHGIIPDTIYRGIKGYRQIRYELHTPNEPVIVLNQVLKLVLKADTSAIDEYEVLDVMIEPGFMVEARASPGARIHIRRVAIGGSLLPGDGPSEVLAELDTGSWSAMSNAETLSGEYLKVKLSHKSDGEGLAVDVQESLENIESCSHFEQVGNVWEFESKTGIQPLKKYKR